MRIILGIVILIFFTSTVYNSLVNTKEAKVSFRSDAKLELIEAYSNALKGVIDTEKMTFAFSVPISSFEGFNSPLQRQHFNENYLESELFKNATFSGKIIEQLDLTENGSYLIRAKGILNVHGVEKERIIKSNLTIEENEIKVESTFSILLSDHNIDIPKVVRQKITEEIQIVINAKFGSE